MSATGACEGESQHRGSGSAQENREAQTPCLGPVKKGGFTTLPGRRPGVLRVKPLWAPVTGCGETGRGGWALGLRGEAAGRIPHPVVPGLTHGGCNEERKDSVSPALHSSQNRLGGRSHEVSRWTAEQRPQH